MTADGIIFDIDGTLWDSTEVIAARWNQLFAGKQTCAASVLPETI